MAYAFNSQLRFRCQTSNPMVISYRNIGISVYKSSFVANSWLDKEITGNFGSLVLPCLASGRFCLALQNIICHVYVTNIHV